MTVGVAVGLATVVALRPAAGTHVKRMEGSPPVTEAVKGTDPPIQIITPPPVMLTVGLAPVMPVKDES